MNIHLICVGKLKEAYWREACAEYGKRLRRYCTLVVTELKEERLPDRSSPAQQQEVVEAEGQALLKALKPGGYVVALDINGHSLTSAGLAAKISGLGLSGQHDISFIIGGSLGLSGQVLGAADFRLSFSAFTFPHQMMRAILLEQLYRAFKINNNETYHK